MVALGFVCPVPHGPKLVASPAQPDRRGIASEWCEQVYPAGAVGLVFTATITGQERRQCSLNNPECMPIPARAF
jgi:hypothetical protein